MRITPTINFADMDDKAIAAFGLRAGRRHFEGLLEEGALTDDSFFQQVGAIEGGTFVELGRDGIGDDWKQFKDNVSPDDGKIATVVEYGVDSIEAAYRYLRDRDEKDPRGWTGGVRFLVRVELTRGHWRERVFAGGGSGVQGHFDMSTVYATLTAMAAAWALGEKARFELEHELELT